MTVTNTLLIHISIMLCSPGVMPVTAFVPTPANRWGDRSSPNIHPRGYRAPPSLFESMSDSTIATTRSSSPDTDAMDRPTAVRAPLKYVGPYPCIGLRFPDLATKSQRERNVTGISLDFVLDTAANTNTINAAVASELGLDVVGSALPGVGAGGAISGGDTYMLGNCELEGLPAEEEAFTFISGLTASALPVASPAAAGLLGIYFFNAFPGGVQFTWGNPPQDAADSASDIPSVTFFSSRDDMDHVISNLQKVPIKQLPVSGLPSVNLRINGVEVPALLDTGSPITVLNAEAARLAGVETIVEPAGGNNPFAKLNQGFKSAQAAARGDILLIAGAGGERVELVKSKNLNELEIGDVKMGPNNFYVGDLPGLAALGGLGGSSAPPAAVLGMDILRTRPRLVYRPEEVYL